VVSKSIEEVISELNIDPEKGLSKEEVKVWLEKYGENLLIAKKTKGILNTFTEQLQD
jgi:magnesium-transporting ATPase (P-type)